VRTASIIRIALMMEAVRTSEASVRYETALRFFLASLVHMQVLFMATSFFAFKYKTSNYTAFKGRPVSVGVAYVIYRAQKS
jgi:heme O synthase-like polyprenyltransferase